MKQDSTSQMKTVNYTKICNLGKNIFSQLEGRIEQTDKTIAIVCKNMLGDKKVECKVSIGLLNCKEFPFCVDGEEKTYSIIGGCGCPCVDLKEVEERVNQTLERYKFRQKQQINLFDFNWEEE